MAATCFAVDVMPVVLTKLLATSALTALVTGTDGEVRIYDHTPPRPVYPYLRLETSGHDQMNTMGAQSDPKWGALVRFRVRAVSQYRGEREVRDLMAAVMACLNGYRTAIEGVAGRPICVAVNDLVTLEEQVGAVITREWLQEFEIPVHQEE